MRPTLHLETPRYPREMNEEQFDQLLERAYRNEAPAEILAAVELEPGLVTRAGGENGWTILHGACGGGHVDLARDLVDRQADVNQRSTHGFDALMSASINGHIPVMEFLLSRGADMTTRNIIGVTALGLAALCDKLPACKFLISRGSDIMAKNNDGKTALDLYGYGPAINPPLSAEEKKERCEELKAAFLEAKDRKIVSMAKVIESQAAKIAMLKRPAASMLFSDKFADVVFVCGGGERIPAHRNIVAACSESLDALLSNPQWLETADDRERVAEVPMEQSAAAVRVMLRFMYTGEVDEAGLSLDVLDLSSRHLLPELKTACEKRMAGSLTVPSVTDALVAAYLHDLTVLKEACVEFIKANMARVMMSSSFVSLKTDHPAIWKELRVALGLPEEEQDTGKPSV